MSDYGTELLEKVRQSFSKSYANDKKIAKIEKRLANNSVSYEDANEYSIRLGELLSEALTSNLNSDTLSGNFISRELADEILRPVLTDDYSLIAEACRTVQKNQNKASNIGLTPQVADLDTNRIDGLVKKVSSYDTIEQCEWVLKEPIVNYSQAVVDDSARKNMEVYSKAGLEAKIIRKPESGACKWCRGLAGTYDYADVKATGSNVYRRHAFCRCQVTYANGKVRQNVWTKADWEVEEDTKRAEQIEIKEKEKTEQIEAENSTSPTQKQIVTNLEKGNIERVPLKKLNKVSETEIIKNVSGGDRTNGSCASAALAYIGNKAGYDVKDFRGGDSCTYFQQGRTYRNLCDLNGVVGKTYEGKNGFKVVIEALKEMEIDKEYFMATGRHAAIIKRTENGTRYLELQSPIESENGFKPLTKTELKKRFGVVQTKRILGKTVTTRTTVIDAESLENSNEFLEILQFINTNSENERKGVTGAIH